MSQRQEPVTTEVQAYTPIQVDPIEPTMKDMNKGKDQAIGIQINEP